MDQRTKLAWSIDDLAVAVGVCRDRIYTDIREGKLVARRIGKRRTIVADDEARRYLNALPQVELPPAEGPSAADTDREHGAHP
jgi:hypothetical protein